MENRFLTPEAIQKLLEVKQHILEEPNRLSMQDWVQDKCNLRRFWDYLDGLRASTGLVSLNPPCGTAACIAGWICILNGKKGQAGPGIAVTVLGINREWYDIATRLFYTSNWDDDLRKRFTTTNLRERASAAAEQIDRFIERHKIAA